MKLTKEDFAETVKAEWAALEGMVELARWSWTQIDEPSGEWLYSRDLSISSLNLCVLFGISIVEKSLLHIKNSGRFSTSNDSLYGLLKASRTAITWCDFARIDSIRKLRNRIAHSGVKFSENECLSMMLDISRELEHLNGISARKRIFMRLKGLSGQNNFGSRFNLSILFPPDTDEENMRKIFQNAEIMAREAVECNDDFIRKLHQSSISIGSSANIKYLVEFKVES